MKKYIIFGITLLFLVVGCRLNADESKAENEIVKNGTLVVSVNKIFKISRKYNITGKCFLLLRDPLSGNGWWLISAFSDMCTSFQYQDRVKVEMADASNHVRSYRMDSGSWLTIEKLPASSVKQTN